ncbi:hypothetical protein PR048_008101 [Dryococelus australis]|uniref:Uncharacterized protein n=1 Tax=Dryococelus australis TaxID=614101 RepID=A0ABQ9HWZ1_9NEOP|nr:hypothetical protein PR048_008101 [Dryococelus australis]
MATVRLHHQISSLVPSHCIVMGTASCCEILVNWTTRSGLTYTRGRGGGVIISRSPPTKANRVQSPAGCTGFLQVGIVPDDAVGPFFFFFGDLPFPPPLHSGAAPYSLQSPSSALKTSLLRAAQISSLTHSSTVVGSLACYSVTLIRSGGWSTMWFGARHSLVICLAFLDISVRRKTLHPKPPALPMLNQPWWCGGQTTCSHHGEPGSITCGIKPLFSPLVDVTDNRWVFSGLVHFPHNCVSSLLRIHSLRAYLPDLTHPVPGASERSFIDWVVSYCRPFTFIMRKSVGNHGIIKLQREPWMCCRFHDSVLPLCSKCSVMNGTISLSSPTYTPQRAAGTCVPWKGRSHSADTVRSAPTIKSRAARTRGYYYTDEENILCNPIAYLLQITPDLGRWLYAPSKTSLRSRRPCYTAAL